MTDTNQTKTATTPTKEQVVGKDGAGAAPKTQAGAGAELTVQDLNVLKQIIDVASQRGAFKANEMAMVGATYNKLEAFLKIVEQSQKDANPTKAPEGDKPAEAK
jgi:hypothetical protein